jgi:hypothetical protein
VKKCGLVGRSRRFWGGSCAELATKPAEGELLGAGEGGKFARDAGGHLREELGDEGAALGRERDGDEAPIVGIAFPEDVAGFFKIIDDQR